ncbi:MAG: ABC transporter ATPase [Bacteroidetes bacterium]|nr:ABC transporter ATPase [Bacteroidota bacterium]
MYVTSDTLPEHSRIWIYQCSRELTNDELVSIGAETKQFLEGWTAHNQVLKAGYEFRYNRFLILMIDEKTAGASGCSIDKSVHFILSLEKKYGLSFMDRMKFAYKEQDRVEVVSRNQFEDLFSRGMLNGNSIVFNNLIATKKELQSEWEVALNDSWHKELVGA